MRLSARWSARLALALLIGLVALGLQPFRPDGPVTVATAIRDVDLYRAIIARVERGEPYHAAAAAEQRALGYPLRPFVTMRLPLLAEVSARIGRDSMRLALPVLVLIFGAIAALRLRTIADRRERIAAIALLAPSLILLAQGDLAIWHEVWAAVFVALALVVRTPARWGLSVALALIAALLRELAMPILAAMAFVAFVERRPREGLGWLAALGVAMAALGWHAAQVAAVTLPGDAVSPGWAGGGWRGVVFMMSQASGFTFVPVWLTAILVPLALLGWAMRPEPLARRVTLWTGGMMLLFALAGRPNNFYWGVLVAPLLPVGLAFAVGALSRLVRMARGAA